MNDIQIDLQALPIHVRRYVKGEIRKCNDLGISVHLLNKRHAYADGIRCHGFFCNHDMKLVVACYKPIEKWLPIMVHETCHRDQWSAKAKVWTRRIDGEDPLTAVFEWLEYKRSIPKKHLREYLRAALDIELDCERRAVQKIIEGDLPIDVTPYIQRGNAYVYFYLALEYTRKWYAKGRAPHAQETVWRHMATHFDGDYTKIPRKYKSLVLEHCYDR